MKAVTVLLLLASMLASQAFRIIDDQQRDPYQRKSAGKGVGVGTLGGAGVKAGANVGLTLEVGGAGSESTGTKEAISLEGLGPTVRKALGLEVPPIQRPRPTTLLGKLGLLSEIVNKLFNPLVPKPDDPLVLRSVKRWVKKLAKLLPLASMSPLALSLASPLAAPLPLPIIG